jgi:hypothetical protein
MHALPEEWSTVGHKYGDASTMDKIYELWQEGQEVLLLVEKVFASHCTVKPYHPGGKYKDKAMKIL